MLALPRKSFNAKMTAQTPDAFAERHARYTRAIQNSLAKEAALIKQLRQLKDQIVERSLQLGAALNQKVIDSATISDLRAQAAAASNEAQRCKAKEAAAKELIQKLRIDLRQVQGQLREKDALINRLVTADTAMLPTHPIPSVTCDNVTDSGAQKLPSQTSQPHSSLSSIDAHTLALLDHKNSRVLTKLTPFQQWKKERHIITPNTPSASENFIFPGQEPPSSSKQLADRDPFGYAVRSR